MLAPCVCDVFNHAPLGKRLLLLLNEACVLHECNRRVYKSITLHHASGFLMEQSSQRKKRLLGDLQRGAHTLSP